MNNAISRPPVPVNEPVQDYAPGTPQRAALQAELAQMRNLLVEVGPIIGGQMRRTGKTAEMRPPHEHQRLLGHYHKVQSQDVHDAIQAARDARPDWMRMHWTDRAAIFLKAADLLAGPYRDRLNAATMLGQSKNAYQAEIDSACELIDFWRYNVQFMTQIYEEQPVSPRGVWNRVQYRPLEGFVFAITPFNFTAIAGNLPTSPAMMGNTVLWKPASTQVYSAAVIMELLTEAGLPPGVINLVPGDGADVGDPILGSEHFSGLHFTGSTGTFNSLWRTIGQHINSYRSYPRIVGETGGKDFIVAHESADPVAIATAITRGGFEYQGQKCSAVSRVYLPHVLWPDVEEALLAQLLTITVGPVEDFRHFMNAVIDRKAFQSITGYIDRAKHAPGVKVIHGGTYSDEEGYFIAPTVLRCDDPHYESMEQEIFGPVVSVYVTPETMRFEETLRLIDKTSPYALTGAVFARDRAAIAQAMDLLADNVGNFYINDKPTGAVVGQQPFGGARGSGTNDKAGSYVNLLRWTSLRAIKETFVPPTDYRYPFLLPEQP